MSNILSIEEMLGDLEIFPPAVVRAVERVSEADMAQGITLATQQAHSKEVEDSVRSLRYSFWGEHALAISQGRKMRVGSIFSSLMTRKKFDRIIADPVLLGFILTPFKDYNAQLKEVLDIGTSKVREIMSASVLNDEGKLDLDTAKVILQAFKLLDSRVYGSPTQKLESKSLNVNISQSSESEQDKVKEIASLTATELDRRIKQLMRGSNPTRDLSDESNVVIDVKEEEVTISDGDEA